MSPSIQHEKKTNPNETFERNPEDWNKGNQTHLLRKR
jgi:hypothetical protein